MKEICRLNRGMKFFDESTGREIVVLGKHFDDFDVEIHETYYDEFGVCDEDNVTDAIFTEQEIRKLAHARRVIFDE